MFDNWIASSAGLPINKSTHFLWYKLLPIVAMPVCRSKNQQLFSGLLVRKSNCQLCRPANQQINTISLTYTIANTSSAGLPINKSTQFLWHILLQVPALPVSWATNQQLFSGLHARKFFRALRSANESIITIFMLNRTMLSLLVTRQKIKFHVTFNLYSAGLSINLSTHFFWYTCSKIFIAMFYEY